MAVVLRSRLLERHGFRHGFSLRTGGTSEAPFDTLNLGRAVGDRPEHVQENHARFARAVGYPPGALLEVSQVHGAQVRLVDPADDPAGVRRERADALVAVHEGGAVGVRVADCVPVLIGDPSSGGVAAVHAGWRGCVAGVVDEALAALRRHTGADPAGFVAAIGPHIRADAFEVGPDVAEQLRAAASGVPVVHEPPGGTGKPHVDLAAVVQARLRRAGLPADHIDDVGGCTFHEPERFFSYRRDGPRSGRHLGAIVARSG